VKRGKGIARHFKGRALAIKKSIMLIVGVGGEGKGSDVRKEKVRNNPSAREGRADNQRSISWKKKKKVVINRRKRVIFLINNLEKGSVAAVGGTDLH